MALASSRKLVAIFLILFSIPGCTSLKPAISTVQSPTQQSNVPVKLSKGITFVHGLNNSPGSMTSIARAVTDRGYNSDVSILPGHHGEQVSVAGDLWSEPLRQKLRTSKEPVTVIGFSLGSLVVLDAVQKESAKNVSRIVLLAPPLELRTWVKATNLITKALPSSWCLPSFAPKAYRLYPCLPIEWYRSVAELQKRISTTPNIKFLENLPVTVVVSTNDELIDSQGVINWITNHELSWKTIRLSPKSDLPDTFNHYIVDPRSTGVEAWNRLIEELAP